MKKKRKNNNNNNNKLGTSLTPTFGDLKSSFCASLLNTSAALASPYVKFSSIFPCFSSSVLDLFNTKAVDQTAS